MTKLRDFSALNKVKCLVSVLPPCV